VRYLAQTKKLVGDDWVVFGLLVILPTSMGVWFLWDIYQRWSEELTVFGSELVRNHNGKIESLAWSDIANMEIKVGGWLLEWLLLQIGGELPRLTITSARGETWVYRANMAEIDQLCQLVPSLWTAHQAGMRPGGELPRTAVVKSREIPSAEATPVPVRSSAVPDSHRKKHPPESWRGTDERRLARLPWVLVGGGFVIAVQFFLLPRITL